MSKTSWHKTCHFLTRKYFSFHLFSNISYFPSLWSCRAKLLEASFSPSWFSPFSSLCFFLSSSFTDFAKDNEFFGSRTFCQTSICLMSLDPWLWLLSTKPAIYLQLPISWDKKISLAPWHLVECLFTDTSSWHCLSIVDTFKLRWIILQWP